MASKHYCCYYYKFVINSHVFFSSSFLTGVKCKLGGSPSVLPHLVPVHDDFPAVSLERLHPVFCPNAGGVSLGLLGPQRKPDGESKFHKTSYYSRRLEIDKSAECNSFYKQKNKNIFLVSQLPLHFHHNFQGENLWHVQECNMWHHLAVWNCCLIYIHIYFFFKLCLKHVSSKQGFSTFCGLMLISDC